MLAAGYPAVRFTEAIENYTHEHQDVRTENGIQYGDRLKFIDFPYLAKVTALNAVTMAALAMAPMPPACAPRSGAGAWAPAARASSAEFTIGTMTPTASSKLASRNAVASSSSAAPASSWRAAADAGGRAAAPARHPAAPAPKPVPAPMPVPVPVPQQFTLKSDALFDFDKSVLTPADTAKLDDLASKISAMNLEVVIAIGHTDPLGSSAYNQKLSVRRADSVKSLLVSKGVDANRIYTEGKGESQQVKACPKNLSRPAMIKCLAPNRRVEIEVVGTQSN